MKHSILLSILILSSPNSCDAWGQYSTSDRGRGQFGQLLSPSAMYGATMSDQPERDISSPLRNQFLNTAVPGPPLETKPDYDKIVGPLGRTVDNLFLILFRTKLEEHVGEKSPKPLTDFSAIIDLASRLNQKFSDPREVQRRAQKTLSSMFPSWLPGSYAKLFSKPFPAFSARMNAWATWQAGTWLMGECEVNDVVVDGQKIGNYQGLLVKRCRFLEESGCASVCVNSCKKPTQNFFMEEMGLPLTMEPNYDTFECQFSFGRTPDAETESFASNTPCLMRCPTAGALRQLHQSSPSATTSVCGMMSNSGDLREAEKVKSLVDSGSAELL